MHKNLFFLGQSDSDYKYKIHTADAGRISIPFFKKNYLSWEYILSLVSEGQKDDGKWGFRGIKKDMKGLFFRWQLDGRCDK